MFSKKNYYLTASYKIFSFAGPLVLVALIPQPPKQGESGMYNGVHHVTVLTCLQNLFISMAIFHFGILFKNI